MTLENRATPLGDLVAAPGRGLVFGNRGCLHDPAGRVRRRFNGRRWIACRLEFRGRHRGPLMQPGRYTELFFLDEATALAAGHRPCAECRREDYVRFVATWSRLYRGETGADAIDERLHDERVAHGTCTQRHHTGRFEELPDGAYVLVDGDPWVVASERLLRWTAAGYDARRARRASGPVIVITPPSLVAVLGARWRSELELLHPSASAREA